jgi:hypothetical protein
MWLCDHWLHAVCKGMCTLRAPSAVTIVGFCDNSQHHKNYSFQQVASDRKSKKNHGSLQQNIYGSIQPKDTSLKGCDAVLLVSSFWHCKGQNIKIFWYHWTWRCRIGCNAVLLVSGFGRFKGSQCLRLQGSGHWRWRHYIISNLQEALTQEHSVTSHKTQIDNYTAVKPSHFLQHSTSSIQVRNNTLSAVTM